MTRAEIKAAIKETAERHKLDYPMALKQCQTESAFRTDAVNPTSGCIGLFQIAPRTAEVDLGVKNPKVALKDPQVNIAAWGKYMRWLLNRYKGDYAKALAAYNWGLGKLERNAIKPFGGKWRDHLPLETSNYLKKIMGAQV